MPPRGRTYHRPTWRGDANYDDRMNPESIHICERIRRPVNEVYEYAADPANLPEWAPGPGSAVEKVERRSL